VLTMVSSVFRKTFSSPLFRTAPTSGSCLIMVSLVGHEWVPNLVRKQVGVRSGRMSLWSTEPAANLAWVSTKETLHRTPNTRNVGCGDTTWGLWTGGNRLVSHFCGVRLSVSCLRAPVWPGAGLGKSAIRRVLAVTVQNGHKEPHQRKKEEHRRVRSSILGPRSISQVPFRPVLGLYRIKSLDFFQIRPPSVSVSVSVL
jgi:hypothetical protein